MKTTHKFAMNSIHIKIIIRGDKKNKLNSAGLCFKATLNKHKVVIALGIICPLENWDKAAERIIYISKGRVKKELVQQWNDIIVRYIDRANQLRFDYEMKDMVLTPEIFKKEIKEDSKTHSFYKFIENLIPVLALRWSAGSIRNYHTTFKKLREFSPNTMYGDLNNTFLIRWEHNLKSRGLGVNSIWRHHKDLRLFINEAIKFGIKLENPYNKFKLIKVKGQRSWLSADEVIRLRELLLSGKLHPSHDKVLKYFLFSCFTGLRISDVKTIRYADLIDGQLIFVPKKTRRYQKILRMPLNETAEWLVGEGTGLIFDTFTEQVTNRILKEVASIASITKVITFHVSRHTFAMRFLQRGGKIEVLQELLGHGDIKTTMEYVHELNSEAKIQIMFLDN